MEGRHRGLTLLAGSGNGNGSGAADTSPDRATAGAGSTAPPAPGADVVPRIGVYGRVDSIGCTFGGVTCRVRVDGSPGR